MAVTRSRTSSSSRPGRSSVKEYAGRGSPQVPTSRTRSVAASRSQSAASTCSHGIRAAAGEVERVPGAGDRRRLGGGPGQHLLPRRDLHGRGGTPQLHSLPDDPVAQRAAVLLEGGELAEHPVVRLGVLDRVGALQLRLDRRRSGAAP